MHTPQPLSNARATLVRSLHRRKGRREHGAFLVEGERALEEIAASDAGVRFGYAYDEQYERLAGLIGEERAFTVDRRRADLFATENSQGIAAVVETPRPTPLASMARQSGPIIVLDGVADPGNVGTIIRSAEWFAVAGVVLLPGTADPYNPKSVRASMGSLVRVAVAEATPSELAALGRPVYALDAGGDLVLGRDALPRSAIYAIGSEAHGISDEVAALARTVAIPGRGGVESLNAAIAGSILLYELSRLDE